jgi:methionyl-tRNA formyltransferase
MRVFISGQKAFGAAVFGLVRGLGHDIAGVAAPLFASDGVHTDRLRFAACRTDVLCLEPQALNADTLPAGVDLIISAHSHAFIGRKTRHKASVGAIGYHPSLLPLHRGRDAVRWTIHMGDKITGGTVYWLTDNVDCGPIAAQRHCFVRPTDTPEALWRRELFPMGLRLFEQVLRDLDGGKIVRIPQPRMCGSWEPSFERPPVMRPDLLMLGEPPAGYYIDMGMDRYTPEYEAVA